MDKNEGRQIMLNLAEKLKKVDFAELEGEYLDTPQYLTVRSETQGMYKVCLGAEPQGDDIKTAITVDGMPESGPALFRLSYYFVKSSEGAILGEGENAEDNP